ncbi:MAG: ankyrin repeat domain-containing protein [Bacillota bacterium]|nr:ankyrin repeat domain-containing protein [Bacillota bacterium]
MLKNIKTLFIILCCFALIYSFSTEAFGVDDNKSNGNDDATLLLIHGIDYNEYNTVKKALDAGAPVDSFPKAYQGDYGQPEKSVLRRAIENSGVKICNELIKRGADVNYIDENGMSQLMFASAYGETDICKLLLENGADIGYKNKKGSYSGTALTSIFRGDPEESLSTTKLLIKSGVEITKRDIDEALDLMPKSLYCWPAYLTADLLIGTVKKDGRIDKMVKDPIIKDIYSDTIQKNSPAFRCVKLMRATGVTYTMIKFVFLAASKDRVDIVRAFVEDWGNPNAVYVEDQGTLLSVAAYCGAKKVVKFLLDAGADPDKVLDEEFELSPAAKARKYGHDDIADMIEKKARESAH